MGPTRRSNLIRCGESYSEVVLQSALQRALFRMNPDLPAEALDGAFHRLTVRRLDAQIA